MIASIPAAVSRLVPSGLLPPLALALLCLPMRPARGGPIVASQSLGTYREDGGDGLTGDTTIGYTAVATSGAHWRARGSFSWWRWSPDDASGQPTEAGLGALGLTLGYSLWSAGGPGAASRGWAQLKGSIPLDDVPNPVSSGRFDWGGSILATNRIDDFLVFIELGYLDPGDPVVVNYDSQFSGALSASWHPRGSPVYPVASYVTASALVAGYPRYEEWSAGLGAPLGSRTGILALYSHGTNAGSPGRGLTVVFSLRL